jgi:hypothetical protein
MRLGEGALESPSFHRMVWQSPWARGILSAKNGLVEQDAKQLEDAFEQGLSELSHCETQEEHTSPSATAQQARTVRVAERDLPEGIDKSVLAVTEARPLSQQGTSSILAQEVCLNLRR